MYCSKCGTFLAEDAIFCDKCGSRVTGANISKKVQYNTFDFDFEEKIPLLIWKAPLFWNSLLMNLLTWPMAFLYLEWLCPTGNARAAFGYYTRKIWERADVSGTVLAVFGIIGIILFVIGGVLYYLEEKNILRLSHTIKRYLLYIPLVVIMLVVLITYFLIIRWACYWGF